MIQLQSLPKISSGEISFSVYVCEEMSELTFRDEGDDKAHKYQSGMISRSSRQLFYLEVSSLAEPLEKEEYCRITGRIGGSISCTENNKMYYIPEIYAEDAAPMTDRFEMSQNKTALKP